MKALLASALTALVLVTAAWASNVTPAQFSALSKRVTKLEKANVRLSAEIAALAACTKLTPFSKYNYRIDWNDGTSTIWSTLEPPAAGDNPDFWVPTASSSSCSSAVSAP